MSPDRKDSEQLISIARIARPQGIRGEVIADLLTDFPERFADLDLVWVKRAEGDLLSLRLENFRLHKNRVVLKFAGYDDINTAEGLRNAGVMITRDQLLPLPDDTWYDFDLIECRVVTAEGADLGRVTDVQNYGAAPLLVVTTGQGTELLIPLALSICTEIDITNKRIVVNPPEGLLDL